MLKCLNNKKCKLENKNSVVRYTTILYRILSMLTTMVSKVIKLVVLYKTKNNNIFFIVGTVQIWISVNHGRP